MDRQSTRSEVEVWEDPAAAWSIGAADRLRKLGFSVSSVRSPLEARPEAAPAVVVVNALLPEDCLDHCLELHRAALREHSLLGLVLGRSISSARRSQLRRAGFSLQVLAPIDQGALRFQVGRGFLARRKPGATRRELRAPVPWAARALASSRQKHVSVYNLSPGGAYLETPRPWLSGTRLRLELAGVGLSGGISGRVVHTNVPGNLMNRRAPVGMGVHFEEASAEQLRAIEAAVRRQSERLLL